MSEVEEETAGLASGLMSTGHELGAAFGVATPSVRPVSEPRAEAEG